MADSIKVLCRFRPQNKREKAENAYIVVRVSDDHTMCEIKHPDKSKQPKPLTFNFDCVFDWTSTQTEVYEHAASHLVEQIFDGFNATIFAYGQTGAGKTYSMEGTLGSPHRGIVPRTVEHIFEHIADAEENMEYLLQVSYVEIYLEQLRDLLSPGNSKMRIRDSKTGVYIEAVTQMYVRNAKEVIDIMTRGSRNRTVNATGMNAAVCGLNVMSMPMSTDCLNQIDLAGSEKVSKTGAQGTLLKEAQKINQSLSALGNVMSQLSSGKPHISYRDSVLTRLLSDSLGGNCKTTLLIAVSPSSFNADETITTCRFGVRAKKIKNKAKINAEKTVAEYKVEVAALNEKIKGLQTFVKMLKNDLSAAKAGDLGADDEGESGKLDRAYKEYLMDDGKGKKKKKPKKKGFFREGYVPPAAQKKAKKKKKGKEEEDEEEEETKDASEQTLHQPTSTETSFMEEEMVPASTLQAAEEKIKFLEKEVIKAQAAAATASGLGDFDPMSPGNNHRQSILPKPHRPTHGGHGTLSDLPGVGAMLKRQSSGRKSGPSSPIPNDLPPSTTMLKKQASLLLEKDVDEDWEDIQGDMYSQLQTKPQVVTKTVTETVMEMPTHLADLDPALLELARRELQQENNRLRKWMEQVNHELEQEKIRTQKKAEALQKARYDKDDAEMECDRLMLQQQVLEERIESFEQDRQREREQIASFKEEKTIQKKEIEQLKARFTAKEKEAAAQIAKIKQREALRAEAFMKKAMREFKKMQEAQRKKEEKMALDGLVPQPANGRSAYEMMSINEQQQRALRERQLMNQQMQRLKEATFEQLERIQMEQMKVKSALENKIEECVQLKIDIKEMDEQLGKYMEVIKEKDTAIRRQATELKAFGDLKLMSDKIHQKEYKNAQDTIFSLKKQLNALNRMNKEADGGGSVLSAHQMQVMPLPLRGGGRKRKQSQIGKHSMSPSPSPSPNGHLPHHSTTGSSMAFAGNVPTPLRGGGGTGSGAGTGGGTALHRNGHLSGASKTSDFFNSALRKNTAHSLTPSYSFSPRLGGHKPSKSGGQRSISDATALGMRSISAGSNHSSNSGYNSGQSSGYTNIYSTSYNQGQSKRRSGRGQADARRQNSYW